MSYVAVIRRVSDGVTRTKSFDLEWEYPDEHGSGTLYLWDEGNFSCDCNRSIFFGDEERECGDGAYLVRIELPDGSVPYDEINDDSSVAKEEDNSAQCDALYDDGHELLRCASPLAHIGFHVTHGRDGGIIAWSDAVIEEIKG